MILILCVCAPSVWAQPRPSSPRVDGLRRALDTKTDRSPRQAVQQQAQALHGINELRWALELPGWRLDELAIRRGILERFLKQVAEVARSKSLTNRLAAATVIGEMGPVTSNLRLEDEIYFTAQAAPILGLLMKDRDRQVRETAARSLAKLNAPARAVADAYRGLMEKPRDVSERRLAAETALSFIALKIQLFEETREGIKVTRQDLVDLGDAIVPLVARGLRDPDAVVRRRCVLCLQRLAEALTVLIPVPKLEDRGAITADMLRKEWQFIRPLVERLGGQAKTLADLLTDRDAEVRLRARQALDELARARLRLRRRQAGVKGMEKVKASGRSRVAVQADNDSAIPDVLGEDLEPAVQVLARGITDSSAEIRLAAIEFLELLEEAAAPAAPALIRTLADDNHFVRWAAARTLGRLGPLDRATIRKALPGLARLLTDPDLDLRLAAASTLADFGPESAPAIPALVRATQEGDPEIRMAAMQTLLTIGLPARRPEADRVVTALTAGLKNSDARVRQTAAETLGALGKAAQSAIPTLQAALQDESMEVRRAVSGALLDIGGK
jgi:HEAT repeat protein